MTLQTGARNQPGLEPSLQERSMGAAMRLTRRAEGSPVVESRLRSDRFREPS